MRWIMAKNKRRGRKRRVSFIGRVWRLLRSLFGTLALLAMLLALLYSQCEPFREALDELGIITTTTASAPVPTDPEGKELLLHYIDVGQGDATLLQTPSGSVLIDCGVPAAGEDLVAYIRSLGIERLEYFIITHPDEDHMGSAAYVINNLEVGTVVMNGQEKTAKFFTRALEAMEERGVEGIIAEVGDTLTVGALSLRVLGPQRLDYTNSKWNNASIMIHATYGERSFLFTGDAESEAEAELVESFGGELRCDIFSAGHHGSRSSNSLALLRAAAPEYVVISCGKDNSYGHPHEDALKNFASCGITVLRTDEDGTIVFATDGSFLELRSPIRKSISASAALVLPIAYGSAKKLPRAA